MMLAYFIDPRQPTSIHSPSLHLLGILLTITLRDYISTFGFSYLPKQSTIIETEYVVKDVVAPTFWDKMEHLGELQRVRAVVD